MTWLDILEAILDMADLPEVDDSMVTSDWRSREDCHD